MKIRVLLVSLLTTAVSLTGLQAAEDTTPLGERMEKMSAAFRAINRNIADASKNAETLQQIATMRAAAEEAMTFEPAKKAEIPAAEQEKFVANYKDTMKGFLGQLTKLEALLKAGDNAGAQALITSVKADQKDAHTKYKIQKKKK